MPFPLSLSFLFAMDAALRDAHMLLSKMQAMAFGAAQGNLSILELSIMDAQFQSLLEQVDRATYLASFDGIRLLNGGADVCLEGRPPTHRLLLHDTPDATSNAFGFCQLNVSLPSHALVALASVSNALRWIGVFRFEARQELWLLLR